MELDLLEYENMPVGTTANGPCPACGKKKFYVTRKADGLAYICHRATCDLKPGYTGTNVPALVQTAGPVKTPNRQYTDPLHPKTEDDVGYFWERFGVDLDEHRYAVRRTEDGRYAIAILAPNGDRRGWVIRRATWEGEPAAPISDDLSPGYPKSMHYYDIDAEDGAPAWFIGEITDEVVIVEDPVSAMRIVSEGWTAVALMGTWLKAPALRELIGFGAKRYIVALDADVPGKCIKMAQTLRGCVERANAVLLQQDPKDYEDSVRLLEDLGVD